MQYVQEHSNGIPSEHAHQPIISTQSNTGRRRIAAELQDARLKQASRGGEKKAMDEFILLSMSFSNEHIR
jgi:hypothetical protein